MTEREEQNERLRKVVEAVLTSPVPLPRATIIGRLSSAIRPDGEASVFGRELRKRRRAAGMTLIELARWLDSSPSTISNWENAKIAAPTPSTQRRVFAYLAQRADAG